MWIVRVALNRPYTFIVLALLILILSPVVILRTPTDIFPNINIPVIAVAWQYTGLNPEEMEGRLTRVYERTLTTTVDNIEHIESTTVNGEAIVKIARSEPGHRKRPGNCHFANRSAPASAGHVASVGH
jgi:multidrug efflux pump subunit AcrB